MKSATRAATGSSVLASTTMTRPARGDISQRAIHAGGALQSGRPSSPYLELPEVTWKNTGSRAGVADRRARSRGSVPGGGSSYENGLHS